MDKLPAQMTVIGISKPGGPEVLLPDTRAVPLPGPGEILFKVPAAGVNRPYVSQRSGTYPPPPRARDLSGIGTIASRVAKAFGSKVIVTVGSKEKADAWVKLGADRRVNYKTEDFVAEVKAGTAGAGADVILDMVGCDYIERNYDAAAVDGRIVQIAFLGGPKTTINFTKLMVKRLHHTGSTLRPRSNADQAAMVAPVQAQLTP